MDRGVLANWLGGRASGVNFIGPIEFVLGIGTSARGYMKALQHSGVPLNVIPWDEGYTHKKRIAVDYPVCASQPVNILHINLDQIVHQRPFDTGPLTGLLTPHGYNIAIVYWELATLRPEWFDVIRRFDEFWCASSFVANAISSTFSGTVSLVRPALARATHPPTRTRQDLGLPEDRFLFFYTIDAASVYGRKNPRALIDAYVAEFREDEGAACMIRVLYGSADDPELSHLRSVAAVRSDVVLSERFFSDEEMGDLFALIDCYVSPHRSEGLGLTIIEAMLAKKPVIATPYGGVVDFVNARTALPLKYRVTGVGPGNVPYPENFYWADPELASIRTSMRCVFRDRRRAEAVALQGFKTVNSMFSAERTARQIRKELRRIGRTLKMQRA